MRILFAISVVAFVALLWASLSTAQHIRRARRRRRLASSAEPASESRSTDNADDTASRFPLSSQRNIRFTDSGAEQPAAPPPPPRPDPPKPAGMNISPPPVTPLAGGRQDWAYFNHDTGGDLSDPTPRRRYKDHSRPR